MGLQFDAGATDVQVSGLDYYFWPCLAGIDPAAPTTSGTSGSSVDPAGYATKGVYPAYCSSSYSSAGNRFDVKWTALPLPSPRTGNIGTITASGQAYLTFETPYYGSYIDLFFNGIGGIRISHSGPTSLTFYALNAAGNVISATRYPTVSTTGFLNTWQAFSIAVDSAGNITATIGTVKVTGKTSAPATVAQFDAGCWAQNISPTPGGVHCAAYITQLKVAWS